MKDELKGTVRGLERTIAEEGHEWPKDLQDAAQRALLSLQMMVGQELQFTQSQAIREAAARGLRARGER